MTTESSPAVHLCAVRLRRAVLVLARRLRPAFQRDGLSTAKLSVVGHLHRSGQLTPTELAAREGVKLASLTRLVAELERDGWVTRAADVADGRRSILSLTPPGRARLVASAHAADVSLAEAVARVAGANDLAVLEQACGLLESITDTFGSNAEPPKPDAAAPATATAQQGRKR